MNNIKYQKIDTAGQITAVVTITTALIPKASMAQSIMKDDKTIEQVVFVQLASTPTSIATLSMMGNELSINGSLAGAFVVLKQEKLNSALFNISGLQDTVQATLDGEFVRIQFPKSLIRRVDRKKRIVVFEGISYFLVQSNLPVSSLTKAQFELLTELLSENPAAGVIFYDANKIQPAVYVADTDSLVWENACGSGSVAFSILNDVTKVLQPSGKYITITTSGDTLGVSVPVRKDA